MSSVYGDNFRIEIFGESHSKEIGAVISGFPEGEEFDPAVLQSFMDRRSPGKKGGQLRSAASTARNEKDKVIFLSGVEKCSSDGTDSEADSGAVRLRITGEPIKAVIRNENTRSGDYSSFKGQLRPGHADLGAYLKYGTRGLRPGGGQWSGRMTAAMCIPGAIAIQILEKKGVNIETEVKEIGGASDPEDIERILEDCRRNQDSAGGIISCRVSGFPGGVGGAMFQGLEGKISQAVFGVPAVKGIQFGRGFDSARIRGSENNDEFFYERGRIVTHTNNHGGILGGISTGMDIVFDVAIKPIPSISRPQRTVNVISGRNEMIEIKGRHDVCAVPRALPVIEAVTALSLLDILQERQEYALLGNPVSHSLSPVLHSFLGSYGYSSLCLEEGDLERVIRNPKYKGFNVTSPYKRTVINYLDELSPEAGKLQAVNTILRTRDGKLIGYNTDVAGHKMNLENTGIPVKGSKVLVLGTGGASAAVAESLKQLKAAQVFMVSRNPSGKKAPEDGPETRFSMIGYEDIRNHLDVNIIINGTPAGMGDKRDKSPMEGYGNFREFKNLDLAEDLIYDPARTKFIQEAEKAGIRTVNGLDMLIGQAVESSRIWAREWGDPHDIRLNDREYLKRIRTELRRNQMNLVLVGMPGSGKSTIAKRIAKITGRELVDTDLVIKEKTGDRPAAIISDPARGEKVLREIETETIKEVCAGRGKVIATGGGSVLKPENRMWLRANSVVIYISRPLSMLSVKNRPLSQGKGVEKLLHERGWIYEKTADIKIHNGHFFGAGEDKENRGKRRNGRNRNEKGKGFVRNSYNRDINSFARYVVRRFDQFIEEGEQNEDTDN